MNDLTVVRLDAPRLPRRGLVCPACGRVHGVGKRVFGLALLLAVVLSLPVGGLATAEAGAARSARGAHARLGVGAEPLPASALTASPLPPDPIQIPAPAPLTVPDTAVVWNRDGTGTYLWDRPGGAIAGFIENGLVVRLMERWEAHGGVPFGEIELEGVTGWADMRAVHRVALPEGGFERLPVGANLYDSPGGTALTWLTPGTPVVVLAMGGAGWAEVELVVGDAGGWVLSR
jgi:hypothetical protein